MFINKTQKADLGYIENCQFSIDFLKMNAASSGENHFQPGPVLLRYSSQPEINENFQIVRAPTSRNTAFSPGNTNELSKMSELFRREAIAHKSQRFHGTVVLTRTWSYPALTLFFSLLIAAILGFALMFGFTRKETVSGVVVPDRGLIRLVAPQQGVVSHIYALEGQNIQAGDLLFVLSSERAGTDGGAHAAIRDSLMSRIAHLRAELGKHDLQAVNQEEVLTQRLRNLSQSERIIDDEIVLRSQKIQIARDLSARIGELAKDGAVSINAAQEKKAELIEQESRLAALTLERMDLRRQIAALHASHADLPLQSGRDASRLRREIEELNQQVIESDVRRQVLVRADQSGRVAAILINPGQAVLQDERIANIVPSGSLLEAELYAPTRAVGFVHAGTDVLLRFDAYPYQKFGQFRGTVREVSLSAIPLSELQGAGASAPGASGAKGGEAVYRIRVKLDTQGVLAGGRAHSLKPGMQVSASLVLEKRTLAEWVLEPLYGIARRL